MPARLLISDANILIDMETGGLLRAMFRLDATFAVPNTLFEEELREQHPDLPRLGLRMLDLAGEAVADADRMVAAYSKTGASINDLLALALARQEQCPLLTGDRRLREAAEIEQIECCGTVWLIGQLLETRVIAVPRAKRAYDSMRAAGRRLPWEEAEKQLRAFGK
jgi:predicted nucleic acid-binding protein